MKKNLLASYVDGIKDKSHGEGFASIIRYFYPEFVTAVILYSVPLLVDARWIAHLRSTSSYATLGLTNTLLHSIIKMAEGLSVGTIVLAGQQNGLGRYKQAGDTLINAFWTTVVTGILIATFLFVGAPLIYSWYGVPDRMVELGVPFLQVRAIGIFFTFVYFAFIGFLRGIKNTKTPMRIFVVGSAFFLVFDYLLIFGGFGIPAFGLMGSALASVIQYGFMSFAAIVYVLWYEDTNKYGINLLSSCASWSKVKMLYTLSWPVMIDKTALAVAYIWLGKCLAPMGTNTLASFSVIKDLERFAFLPAIACAQVITFLVSNDYGTQNWAGIKSNIKKLVFISSILVFLVLFVCSLDPVVIIQLFDFKGDFTNFSARAFPIISVLVFFDVLQLILAGAMRGAANVKTVMWTRLIVCYGFFAPLAYLFSNMHIVDPVIKFVLVYGSLYLGNAIMSVVYIRKFRGDTWKRQTVEGV